MHGKNSTTEPNTHNPTSTNTNTTTTRHPNSLEMMEVVSLGGREEGEVVTAVGIERRQKSKRDPEPDGCYVRAHQKRTEEGRHHVGEGVF